MIKKDNKGDNKKGKDIVIENEMRIKEFSKQKESERERSNS